MSKRKQCGKRRRKLFLQRASFEHLEERQLLDASGAIYLDVQDNVVVAVGTSGDDSIDLVLGADSHVLTVAGCDFEFDASVIDTFRVGSGNGNDTIRVFGTNLDDVGNVLDNHASLTSSDYEVHAFSFDTVIFDAGGGDDFTQIFGSNGDDELQAIPQDTTLTTPTHTMKMLGFERVDSYGRHGADYAAMYGTQSNDQYTTLDTFEVLQGPNMTMRTTGFDRVDAFGRGGDDTAILFDTVGDDHFYVFPEFSVMQSDHLYAVVKDFETQRAESTHGGYDRAYFRDVVTGEHVFASGNIATVTGPIRDVWATAFDEVEIQVAASESPSLDIRDTDFLIVGLETDPSQMVNFQLTRMDGGGTTNHLSFNAQGDLFAGTDVGDVRVLDAGDTCWEFARSATGVNGDRQVASVIGHTLANGDEMVWSLVGNSSNGKLIERNLTAGTASVLASGFNVRSNSISNGDVGQRPRPVGWMLAYDDQNDLFYIATEDGVWRHGRASGVSEQIALAGVSTRGFTRRLTGTYSNVNQLFVNTRTQGLVHLSGIRTGTATETSVSPGVSRFEDSTFVGNNRILGAAHSQGVFLIDVSDLSSPVTTNVTPDGVTGTGNNGGDLRWTATTYHPASSHVAVTLVNPKNGEWVYGSTAGSSVGPLDWFNATPTPAFQEPGSEYFSPPNRVLGKSAAGGKDLTGLWNLVFDPTDPTGQTLVASGTLSAYRTTNFGPGGTWSTLNQCSSVLSMTDSIVVGGKWLVYSAADHKMLGVDVDQLATAVPQKITVTGNGGDDGWGVDSVGQGANTVLVGSLTGGEGTPDALGPHNDVVFWHGNPDTTNLNSVTMISTGWHQHFGGANVPRAGEPFLIENGTEVTVVVYAEGQGFMRATYDRATESFGPWLNQSSGPTSISADTHQVRQIVGKRDGSLLFGMEIQPGQWWRSVDGGDEWTPVMNNIGTSQSPREGRMDICEESDGTLIGIASDQNGVYRVDGLLGTPETTPIAGTPYNGPVEFDPSCNAYVVKQGAGAGELRQFTDFGSAASIDDATDLAMAAFKDWPSDLISEFDLHVLPDGTLLGSLQAQGAGGATFELE